MKLTKTHTTKILAITELKYSKKFLTMSEKSIMIYDSKTWIGILNTDLYSKFELEFQNKIW